MARQNDRKGLCSPPRMKDQAICSLIANLGPLPDPGAVLRYVRRGFVHVQTDDRDMLVHKLAPPYVDRLHLVAE
jgi:hypothetical protein